MRSSIPKALLIIPLLIVVAAVVAVVSKASDSPGITIETHGIAPELTVDELKSQADLIVLATVSGSGQSRWTTPTGKLPPGTTAATLPSGALIFTDTPLHIDRYLKGATKQPDILVRGDGGTVGKDIMTVDNTAELQKGEQALFFLREKDYETANIGPEHYIIVEGAIGTYVIKGDQAVAINQSLALTSLINAVQAK